LRVVTVKRSLTLFLFGEDCTALVVNSDPALDCGIYLLTFSSKIKNCFATAAHCAIL